MKLILLFLLVGIMALSGLAVDKVTYSPELLKNAELGDVTSQCNLGVCYLNGTEVNQDSKEAVKWFKKAAEQGNAVAQYYLGISYYNGSEEITKDEKEALKLWTKSAEQGNGDAKQMLEVLKNLETKGMLAVSGFVQGEEVAYSPELVKKAEGGDAEAQYYLAYWYEYQNEIKNRNYNEAVKWYTKSALQGYAKAQCNLGNCYLSGQGVTQDYKEAVNWYTKGAEQENAGAQYMLGCCYFMGQGVTKDQKEAVKWITKSAEQGNTVAKEELEKLKSK